MDQVCEIRVAGIVTDRSNGVSSRTGKPYFNATVRVVNDTIACTETIMLDAVEFQNLPKENGQAVSLVADAKKDGFGWRTEGSFRVDQSASGSGSATRRRSSITADAA